MPMDRKDPDLLGLLAWIPQACDSLASLAAGSAIPPYNIS